jgi:DNA-binding NarL/FixJ family response regulator
MTRITVLLVIEVRLIGDLLASVLKEEPELDVVGCVLTPEDALTILHIHSVDVMLVSADLPGQNAFELTRSIVEHSPATKVLMVGLLEENRYDMLRYIEAGASGFIPKDASLQELTEMIRLAKRGEARVSTRMAAVMMERLFRLARMFSAVESKINGNIRLTSREMEVLQFISEGLTNQEIAARLVVEVGTVKNHVHRILEKLNVSNRQEAASYLAFIKK